MNTSRLPNSVRKYIRRRKAEIRREVSAPKEADEKIESEVRSIADQYKKQDSSS